MTMKILDWRKILATQDEIESETRAIEALAFARIQTR